MRTGSDRSDPPTPPDRPPSSGHPSSPTGDQRPGESGDRPLPAVAYAKASPSPAVPQRAGADVDATAVRLLGERAVKRNTFADRPGFVGGGADIRTLLGVEAWVGPGPDAPRVWVDVHVATYNGTVVHEASIPLACLRRTDDGGEVFALERDLYQGFVATPGSVDPRPDARVVQYRLYAERAGRVVTDGEVHMCYLKPDAMSG